MLQWAVNCAAKPIVDSSWYFHSRAGLAVSWEEQCANSLCFGYNNHGTERRCFVSSAYRSRCRVAWRAIARDGVPSSRQAEIAE